MHGHFYQPPRENPWTQVIPSQDSAKPYHDWNDRITAECYKPNTRSRALDEHGRILDLLNNFAFLNFNIGPTLMSWMEKYYPDTYQRILEADKKSQERNHGHGNAIAQVYNHIIMPLAKTRDQLTQIIWGKREFAYRFQREAESIWLAETAINQETVQCLIEQGMKYVILSPTQAQRVREIGETEWKDVSNNGIDTTQPYRLFLRKEQEKSGLDEERHLNISMYFSMMAGCQRRLAFSTYCATRTPLPINSTNQHPNRRLRTCWCMWQLTAKFTDIMKRMAICVCRRRLLQGFQPCRSK